MMQKERRKKMKTTLVASAIVLLTIGIVGIGPAFATGDFSLDGNPPSCEDYISPSTCSRIIVTATSLNGFSGTVDLTSKVVAGPSGLTPILNPTSISVPSGGNANSTFTVTASCHVSPHCFWIVNVTGTSGPLSHILQIDVCRGTGCPV